MKLYDCPTISTTLGTKILRMDASTSHSSEPDVEALDPRNLEIGRNTLRIRGRAF
jgi:hypothetical protein